MTVDKQAGVAIETLRSEFETAFDRFVVATYEPDDVMGEVLRYVIQGRGKRVRPILCMLSAEAVGGHRQDAMQGAIAVEMIHTYSLVHDDLPCMDDDDLRRGRPTAHKVFDEARALLAGDGLLTDAFGVLAEASLPPPRIVGLVQELAQAAGSHGMVRGQALDLHWTSRQGATRQDLDEIHTNKTGRLLGAACAMGALAGGADEEVVASFRDYGRLTGLAFQVTDDLLDSREGTGKSLGKDAASGKLTYLSSMNYEDARAAAESYTTAALEALAGRARIPAALTALNTFTRDLLERSC